VLSVTAPVRIDRRQRRRLETIEEIVDVAIEVMTEHGVGGLSLGEVARRMGMRTPSLYVYFDSKRAVYDAVFARGWRSIAEVMAPQYAGVADAADLPAYFLESGQVFLRWFVEHPVHAELMSWRPVPGYQPSADAYAPAVELFAASQASFRELQRRGLFRAELDADHVLTTWTALMSGVMTQQLANAPGEPFDDGRFTSLLPEINAMFLSHFGPSQHLRKKGTP
jgi:AcrR family transcriptional regulator